MIVRCADLKGRSLTRVNSAAGEDNSPTCTECSLPGAGAVARSCPIRSGPRCGEIATGNGVRSNGEF